MCKYLTVVVMVILSILRDIQGLNMTIGSIICATTKNQQPPENRLVQVGNLQVTLTWISVDGRNLFSALRARKQFEEDNTTDIIIVFCEDFVRQDIDVLIHSPNTPLQNLAVVPIQFKAGEYHQSTGTDQAVPYSEETETGEEADCLTTASNFPEDHRKANLTLPISPSSVVVRLSKRLEWKSVFILHDNFTVWETKDLVDKMSQNRVLFALYNIDVVKDLHVLLKQIYDATIKTATEIRFVVQCRHYNLWRLFNVANNFDRKNNEITSLRHFSRWLTIVYEHTPVLSRSVEAWADNIDNILMVTFPKFQRIDFTQVFPALLKEILIDISMEHIESETDTDIIMKVGDRLYDNAMTIHPVRHCKAFKVDTLLWTSEGRAFSTVGAITSSSEVIIFSPLLPNTKFGFNKRKFLISTLSYKPYVMKKTDNQTSTYYGLCIDLLVELARTLNFTYDLVEPEDQKWGVMEKDNKTFNGLVGQLQRREVDMVVAPVTIHQERALVADFSYPFFYDFTTVLVKKTDPNSVKWLTLVYPFKWEVLVCIGIALIGVTLLTFLVETYNPYYHILEHAQQRDHYGGLDTFHNAFWYVYGALLCQGGVHLPDSVAGRTIISCWWLFSMVIVGTYCGNLIAFLTVSKQSPPFNTVKEMISLRDDYKWGTLGGTIWELIFIKTTRRKEFIEIGQSMVEFNKTDSSVLSMDYNVHIQKVKKGGYGLLIDQTTADYVIATECELMAIKEKFLPSYYGIGFPKHSPYVSLFSNLIIYIDERGLIQVWKRKWWPKSNPCEKLLITQAKPIELTDVQSAFYVCVIGIFLGIMALIIETIVHCCIQSRKRKLMSSEQGDRK